MSALLLRPAPMPAIEMAGSECVSPVFFPVIEMVGFDPAPYSDPRSKWPGSGADTPGTHRGHKRSRTGRLLGS